jgi:hypothetical protein
VHCYLADGLFAEWLQNIEMLRRFPSRVVLHVGHGGPVGAREWDWELQFLMELSILPVAEKLGLIGGAPDVVSALRSS